MRRAIFTVLMLLMAAPAFAQERTNIDPNTITAEAVKHKIDPRLEQKVTYKVKLRPIADLVDDLTSATGITFYAGHNLSDWRVREDCATVMAVNIPLSTLMDSIAHTLHFKWVRGGKFPDWTYRLIEDPAAISKVKKRMAELKEIDVRKRKAAWDKFMAIPSMSQEELAQLKEDDPMHYLLLKTGVLDLLTDFLRQTPSVGEAWHAGDEIKLSSNWLPPDSRDSLFSAVHALLKVHYQILADDAESRDAYDSKIEKLNQMKKQITIELNASNKPSDFSWLYINMDPCFPFHTLDSEAIKLRNKAFLQALTETMMWSNYGMCIGMTYARAVFPTPCATGSAKSSRSPVHSISTIWRR